MSEDNVPNSDDDDTAANVIVPNSKRNDYSANNDMMCAVRKWDEITLAFERGGLPGLVENVEWEGKKISAGQWSNKIFSPTRYPPTKRRYTKAYPGNNILDIYWKYFIDPIYTAIHQCNSIYIAIFEVCAIYIAIYLLHILLTILSK